MLFRICGYDNVGCYFVAAMFTALIVDAAVGDRCCCFLLFF